LIGSVVATDFVLSFKVPLSVLHRLNPRVFSAIYTYITAMKKALFLVGVLLPTSGSGLALGAGRSQTSLLKKFPARFIHTLDNVLSRKRRDVDDLLFFKQTQKLPSLILDPPSGLLTPKDIWGADTPTVLSGACNGADTLFAAAALQQGHKVVHLMSSSSLKPDQAKKEDQERFICTIPDDTIDNPRVEAALDEVSDQRHERHEPWMTDIGKRRATYRNWFQTRRAKRVYVVGYRAASSATALDIGGGTGWAVQFYANRFNGVNSKTGVDGEDRSQMVLYFFDDNAAPVPGKEATHNRWSKWIPGKEGLASEGEWQPLDPKENGGHPPPPSGVYAAIGGRRVSGTVTMDPWKGQKVTGIQAINALFEQGTEDARMMTEAWEEMVTRTSNDGK
jgi:hypothetical protein